MHKIFYNISRGGKCPPLPMPAGAHANPNPTHTPDPNLNHGCGILCLYSAFCKSSEFWGVVQKPRRTPRLYVFCYEQGYGLHSYDSIAACKVKVCLLLTAMCFLRFCLDLSWYDNGLLCPLPHFKHSYKELLSLSAAPMNLKKIIGHHHFIYLTHNRQSTRVLLEN